MKGLWGHGNAYLFIVSRMLEAQGRIHAKRKSRKYVFGIAVRRGGI